MSLQRNLERDYAEQINEVMHATIAALQGYDAAGNIWLRDFPRGSCNVTSWLLGTILLELGYETYGQWVLVSRLTDREQDLIYDVSHVWLELRDRDRAIYSVDPTAHQFPEWAPEPFVVEGESPLAQYFASKVSEKLVRHTHSRETDQLFLQPLAHVRARILASE